MLLSFHPTCSVYDAQWTEHLNEMQLLELLYFLRYSNFFPLHYAIKVSGQLDKVNMAFFQKPFSRCPNKYGYPMKARTQKYSQLFELLGIYDHDQVSLFPDRQYPIRTCFKNAVFSHGMHAEHALDAITFYQEKLK